MASSATPETKPAEPKPDRRRFQFSLAGLLTFTTISAVVLSLLRWIYVKYGLETVALTITIAIGGSLHVGCALWAIDDARKRGRSGLMVVALFSYFGPLGVIPWMLLRPSIKPAIRPSTRRGEPDDILADALRLEQNGDCYTAIALCDYVANRWPEYKHYARERITEIEEKRSQAEQPRGEQP